MVRGRLWFRCAAVHDPVTPYIVRPAEIGWKAKERDVPLTIERPFSGEELLLRMKGWITVEPKEAIEAVKRHGILKVLDEEDLVVEFESEEDLKNLARDLERLFPGELDVERI
ncbi:MAG: hypothetical protein ACLFUP_08395 [Desulfobacteraceae bacterium]